MKQHRPKALAALLVLFGVAVLLISVFSARQVFQGVRRQTPTRIVTDVNTIQNWMTIPYISRVFQVPEPLFLQRLNVTAAQINRRSLTAIARLQHRSVQEVRADVQAVIRQYQQSKGAP